MSRPQRATDALVDGYEAVICDLDGVVYRGPAAVPEAVPALRRLVADGLRITYATNNASRLPADVVGQLRHLGAPAPDGCVVTSAEAGAARMRRSVAKGAEVVALGGPGLRAALAEELLVPVPAQQPRAAGVLQGYGPDLRVADFAEAARHVSSGVPWVATNADTTLPVEWGIAPGNGAYVDVLRKATGREPVVVGKPHAPLYELAMVRLGTRSVLAVGDRLDTDIDGARAAGIPSAWVLTGVDRPSDLVGSPDRAVPTFVLRGLHDLEVPYAAPVPVGGGWACGDVSVRLHVDADQVSLVLGSPGMSGDGSAVAVVRAGLAALLEARDAALAPVASLAAAATSLDALLD
ncbi:MAG TPA: HAD-IIA family hydrolase [Intrasporangium sp.]|uniref:HAD-IIA family hydrolase n=1 Tax=Intrasporangium sp. TaxID=1925024 RepID=UPI002D7973DF|nr:HAD-IIA family hydrolase [Intrasporangium sp.]HET7397793.1 HAD-IIA family hydrolase [Intrasporangium sp.]